VKIVWVGLFAVVGIFAASITWLILTPTYRETMTLFNSTMRGSLSGTALTSFDLIQTIAQYALDIGFVITIIAILYWFFMSAQKKEWVTGRYR